MALYFIKFKNKEAGFYANGETPTEAFQTHYDNDLVATTKDKGILSITNMNSTKNTTRYYNIKEKDNKKKRINKKEIMQNIYQDLLRHPTGSRGAECIRIEGDCIYGRFFTGISHWYSKEQEREFGYTVDRCDADSLNDAGKVILNDFKKGMKAKYNVDIDWINEGEKGYSKLRVVFNK